MATEREVEKASIEGEYIYESPSLAEVVGEREINASKGTPSLKPASSMVDECKTTWVSRDGKESQSQGDMNTGHGQMICTADMQNRHITFKSSSPIEQYEPLDINPDGIDGSAPCQSTGTTIGGKEHDEETVCADQRQEKCKLKEKNFSTVDLNEEDSMTHCENKVLLVEESSHEQVCEGATDKAIISESKASSSQTISVNAERDSEDELEKLCKTSEKGSDESPDAEETTGLLSQVPVHEIKLSDSQPVEQDAVESRLEEASTEDHFAAPRSLKNDADELDISDSTNSEDLQLNGDNQFLEEMAIEQKSVQEATEIGTENVLTKVTDDAKGTPENHVSSNKVRDDDSHSGPAEKEIIPEELPSLLTNVISNIPESTNKHDVARDQESSEENKVVKGLQEDPTADKKLQESLGEEEGEYNDEAPEGQKHAEDFDALVVKVPSSKGVTDHLVSEVEHEAVAYESTQDLETNKDSTTKVETEKEDVVTADTRTLEESSMNQEKLDITLSEMAQEETEALVGHSLDKKEENEDEDGVLSPVGTFEQDENMQKEEYKDGGEWNDERSKHADQGHGSVVLNKEFTIDRTSTPESEIVQKNPEEPFHVAPGQSNESMSSQKSEIELTIEKQRSYVNLPEVVKEEMKAETVDGDDYAKEKQTLEDKNIDMKTTYSEVGETKQEDCKENQSPIKEPKDNAQEEDNNLESATFALIDADKVGTESRLESEDRLSIRSENKEESTSQQHSETFAEQDHGAPNPVETATDGGETAFDVSSKPNEGNEKEKDGETFEVQTQQSEYKIQFPGFQSVENDQSDEARVEKTITEEQSSSSENLKKDVDELEKSETVLESKTKIYLSEAPHGENVTRGNESAEGETSETGADKVSEEEKNEPKGSIGKCISTEKIRGEDSQFDQSEKEAIVEHSNTMTKMCRAEEVMDQEELTIEKNSQAQDVIVSDPSEVDIAKQLMDDIISETGGLLHESTRDSKINENRSMPEDENRDTVLANSSSTNALVDREKPNTSLEMAYEENDVSRGFTPVKEDDSENTHGALKENIIEDKEEQHFAIDTEHAQDIATEDELCDKYEKAEDQATGTIRGSETEDGGIEDEDVKLENFYEIPILDRTHVDEPLEVEKSNDISKNLIGKNTGSLDEKEREIVEETQPNRSTETITPNHGKDAQLSKKDLAVVSGEDNDMQPSKDKTDELKYIDASEVVARNPNDDAQENNEGHMAVASGSETKHTEEVEGSIMPTELKEDTTSAKPDKKIPGQGDRKDLTDTMLFSEDKDIEPVSEIEIFKQEIDELKHSNDTRNITNKDAKKNYEEEASVATTEAEVNHEESEKDAHTQQDYVAANHLNDAIEKEPIDETEKIPAHGDAKESTETVFLSEDDNILPTSISKTADHKIDELKVKDESETTGCNNEEDRKDKNEDQEIAAASTSEITRDEVDIQSSIVEREDPKVDDASIKLESLALPEKLRTNHFDESVGQDKPNEIAPDKTELNEVSLSTKEIEIVLETPPSERTEATIASVFKDVELVEKDLIQTAVQHEVHRVETKNNVNTASETATVLTEVKGTTGEFREIEEEPPSSEPAETSRSNLTQGSLDQTLLVAEERKTLDQLSEDYIDNHTKIEEEVDLTSNKMEKSEPNTSIGEENILQKHPVSMTLEEEIESIGNVGALETMLHSERVVCADNARTGESGEEKLESSMSMEPTKSAPSDIWKQSTKETTNEVSACEITVTQGEEELMAALSEPPPKHEVVEEITVCSEISTDINKDPKGQEEEANEKFQAGEEIPKCVKPTKAEERQEAANEVNKARRMSLTTEIDISKHEEEILEFNEEIKVTEKHEEQWIENIQSVEDKEMQDCKVKHAKEEGEDTGNEVQLLLEEDLPGFQSNKSITSDMKVENSIAVPEEKLQEQVGGRKSIGFLISEKHKDIQPVPVTENVDPVINESEQVNASEPVEEEHKVQCGEEQITTSDYKEKSKSSTSIEPVKEELFDPQQLSTKENTENVEDTEPQKSDSSQVPSDVEVSSTEITTTGCAIDSNITHDKQVVEDASLFSAEAAPKLSGSGSQMQREASIEDFNSARQDSRISELVQEQKKSEKEQTKSDEAKENSLLTETANSLMSLSKEESVQATKKENVLEIAVDLDERSNKKTLNEEPNIENIERAENKNMKIFKADYAEEEGEISKEENSSSEVPLVVQKDLVDFPTNNIITEDMKDETSGVISDKKLQVQEDKRSSSLIVIPTEHRVITEVSMTETTDPMIEEPKSLNDSETPSEAGQKGFGEQQLTSHDQKEKMAISIPASMGSEPYANENLREVDDTTSEEQAALKLNRPCTVVQQEAAAAAAVNEQREIDETKDLKLKSLSTETVELSKKEALRDENAGTVKDETAKSEEEEEKEGGNQHSEEKVSPKKSHNILSGVGSKVKHSIAKVKKAITSKHSHPKSTSTK